MRTRNRQNRHNRHTITQLTPTITMKLSDLISLAALASTSSAAAINTPATNTPRAQAPTYICETTEGSPMLHHVNQLIGNLKAAKGKDQHQWCVWHGLGGDECNTQKGFTGDGGGAVFAVCGGPGDDQSFRVSFLNSNLSPQVLGAFRVTYVYLLTLTVWTTVPGQSAWLHRRSACGAFHHTDW